MTETRPPASSTPASPTKRSDDPVDEPLPLSAFVNGVLHLHFAAGASIDLKTTQEAALGFLAIDEGDRASDRVTWKSRRWFSWDDQQIVFSSFDADKDQNWEINSAERRKLADAGHPHGVIASVLNYWARQTRTREPAYSVRAIVALHQLARDGASKVAWEDATRRLEGEDGAAVVARATRRDSPAESTTPSTDEDGEPDQPLIVADDDAPGEDAADPNAATPPPSGSTHAVSDPSEPPRDPDTLELERGEAGAFQSPTRNEEEGDAQDRAPHPEADPPSDDSPTSDSGEDEQP